MLDVIGRRRISMRGGAMTRLDHLVEVLSPSRRLRIAGVGVNRALTLLHADPLAAGQPVPMVSASSTAVVAEQGSA